MAACERCGATNRENALHVVPAFAAIGRSGLRAVVPASDDAARVERNSQRLGDSAPEVFGLIVSPAQQAPVVQRNRHDHVDIPIEPAFAQLGPEPPAEPERRPPLPPVLESVNHRTIGIPLRKEDHRAGLLHRHKSPELPRYRIVVLGAVTRQRHIPATARAQQPGSLRERAAAGRATLGIEQAEYLVSIIHKSTFQVKDGLIDIRQPPSAYRSRKSGPFFRDRSCRFRNPYIRTAGAD